MSHQEYNCITTKWFQCLPNQPENRGAHSMSNFTEVDKVLVSLRLAGDERTIIYEHLAAILHMGNIDFVNTDQKRKSLIQPKNT